MNGYLVLVDDTRYAVQAETALQAANRARDVLGGTAQRVDASRQLTDDELAVLQLTLGEVRVYPATNAFSKKLENHYHALSLYFVFYNFVRIHKTLRVTPAMAAGVTDRLWSMEDIVGLVDDLEVARLTGKRAALLSAA